MKWVTVTQKWGKAAFRPDDVVNIETRSDRYEPFRTEITLRCDTWFVEEPIEKVLEMMEAE